MTESAELIILRHRRALAQQTLLKLRLLSHQVKQRKENLRDLLDDLDLALNVPFDLKTEVPAADTPDTTKEQA